MDYTVKFRLVNFYRPYTDPIDGQEKRAEVMAHHGQVLTTDDGIDDAATKHNVPEDELRRLERLGAFFTEAEQAMMQAGVTDDYTVRESLDDEVRGDTHGSVSLAQGDPDTSPLTPQGGAGTAHPLTFGQMDQAQIEAYFEQEGPTPQQLLDALDQVEPGEKDLLARKFLAAEHATSGGDPRDELVEGIGERLGFAARGPAGSEGVPGTLPDEEGGGASVGGDGSGDGSGASEEGSPAGLGSAGGTPSQEPNASRPAKSYAEVKGIDLSKVKGTGPGGQIIMPDVQKYEAENAQ